MTTETQRVPCISLRDFEQRREEIIQELMKASTEIGFFTLSDHGISREEIQKAFQTSESFFSLPDDVKARTPLNGKNMGWEKNAQVRPSTGTADLKESMQIQFCRMEGLWPDQGILPDFKPSIQSFMSRVQDLSVKVMECFAEGLGLEKDTFTSGTVDPGVGDSQSTLRLLHYHSTEGKSFGNDFWRAGAHADFDVLTLLFQRDGQGGLEVCPGREVVDDFGMGNVWTKVEAEEDKIVCNIGDQLMRWSDDRLKSTFHRVRLPAQGQYQGPRYSIAFFNQARSDVIIQGPKKKYPPITGSEFIAQALARNKLSNPETAAKVSKLSTDAVVEATKKAIMV
ncbi:Clavaminate synthase-like protein [Violaceomyces palustris]|uniref:Clavaminate synthase-like protein n=1 Tax=Violaceomyces palustris TaxID=1673888 RepID=A0ACD0NLL5_9BASI|nr:Clavaminate synthase-like protein [Violaceomyces palustris]